MERRIISIALLLCVLLSLAAPALAENTEITFRAESKSGYAGDTITVPIYIDIPAGKNLMSLNFSVIYDSSVLTFNEATFNTSIVSLGTVGPPQSVSVPNEEEFIAVGKNDPARFTVAAVTAKEITGEKSIPFVTVSFTINADAAPGDYTVIVREKDENSACAIGYNSDRLPNPVPVEFVDSIVTVLNPIRAEMSGNKCSITLHGTAGEGDKIIAALYTDKGRLKEVKLIDAAATCEATFTKEIAENDRVKLMWVDSSLAPKCPVKEI